MRPDAKPSPPLGGPAPTRRKSGHPRPRQPPSPQLSQLFGKHPCKVQHDKSASRPADVTVITTKIRLAASENFGSLSESYRFFISKNSTMNYK